ncbi:MAG TPA: molybdenum cofactor biosynthesis protein MoaE [Kiritimatiellia bacterium]|nr:molybdenum cofactor biosynthesis protein MoaE [Kiritimatiellia bacterium]
MFRLTNQPIDAEALRRELVSPDGGALVEFTGTVRDHNAQRNVVALEYEGVEGLAQNEFAKIEAEARNSFSILRMACVHRTGRLEPGEPAVWMGVTAVHREAAFAACQYGINQLKKRLPIWKKEHYREGDSGWINSP